jgi:GTP cyclohydrolase FolE2
MIQVAFEAAEHILQLPRAQPGINYSRNSAHVFKRLKNCKAETLTPLERG